MKDYVLELASRQTGFNAKLNIMREYLQAYILRIMYDQGLFRTAAFLGGTALRFLYNLPRFSEDLDLSLVSREKYRFIKLIEKIKEELILAGYSIFISYNDQRTVHYSLIKFEGLMYEAGISSQRKQRISIKLEIDTNPPQGAGLKTDIVNKYFPISFLSYDLASLFSGKLHALLTRKYTKGRDFFDLGWYLSKKRDLLPNIALLQNSLKQTGWEGSVVSQDNWREIVCVVVAAADWNKVNQDTAPFLANPSDMNIFTKENILGLLKS